ncbi:PAB-dependent poly(A)-specific ribonuclease subunit PAN2 [Rhizoctonia solani 123E]|uniref:PAN2-PAN3 deadenylation complex catalytic subunit PAN2 n=1 Tax=Rhizoctonia solani 123E TaxID=1423351 RepID=A0A074S751_9AGAM|nr:PAB-dependent poly(A)-specific ribonuclease subunit PAN2 [Rhizoctonia solani 123E]
MDLSQPQPKSTYYALPSLHLTHPVPVTALSFDPVSDVLWTGSATGLVTGYFGNISATGYAGSLTRGVTFPVRGETGVLKIMTGEKDIKALGSGGLGSWTKGGAGRWQFIPQEHLSTFTHHPTIPNTSVVAAQSPSSGFHIVNAITGASLRRVTSPFNVSHLTHVGTLLVSGTVDGMLRTHDFRTRGREDTASENSCIAHTGGIQALEAAGNYIFTAGWGIRQSHPHAEHFVKVFDMRTLRPLSPIPFADLPSFIRVHPKKPTTLVIASGQGFVNVIDVVQPGGTPDFVQAPTSSYLASAAISPEGDYVALGDAEGFVHLLSSVPENASEPVPFNGFEGEPAVWAHKPDLPEIHWSDETPLNTVGLPYYKAPLLSSQLSLGVPHGIQAYPPPAKIPPKVLDTMRTVDFVGYAQLPKDLVGRRNVAPTSQVESGRFRSTRTTRKASDVDAVSEHLTDVSISEIPKHYRRVEIMYSKFGVEDFDFAYYNKTAYSGLETHIVNSYTNALLQALHHVHSVRRVAQSHITTPCQTEHCLLCEFGFLTRMLEDAKGVNCQASNFCKTIPKIQQAGALGVVDYQAEGPKRDYGAIIQVFNRFLLEEMSARSDVPDGNPWLTRVAENETTANVANKSTITQLMGIDAKSIVMCSACGATTEKDTLSHVVDLTFLRKPHSNVTFSSLLSASILRETTHRSVCQSCKQQATFRTQRIVPANALPPVLAVNTAILTDDAGSIWRTKGQNFLTPDVTVTCGRDGRDIVEYELRSMVVEVKNETHAPHLVALTKIPRDGWYLFNDFVVQSVTEAEALSFVGAWKTPCVLYLERTDNNSTLDFNMLPMNMDPAILCNIDNISWRMNKAKLAHEPLTADELPTPGTLVAIDAEFVSLQKEENEMRSDGTKKVIRPSQLCLARVSVLREDGKAFIDDYIHTSDTIVDYLTEFSGIKPGDLDPYSSEHALVPLKTAYKKLRLLIDLGCIFIGHGLSKDFRIINIAVPKEQVIDTVDIYFLKERQRRIGLRFLSWYLLRQTIQIDTHNSIEDARAALFLYNLYVQLDAEGQFEDTLDEIYREGRKLNWKTPGDPTSPKPAKAQVAAMSPSISGTFTPPYGSPSTGGTLSGHMPKEIYPIHLTTSSMVIVVPPGGRAQRTYATEYKSIVARYVRSPAKSASSIVIISSPDVDALCATRILVTMFRNENVLHRVTPISGYPDLTAYREELLKSPELQTIILVNIGAILDLLSEEWFGDFPEDVAIHVIDSTRPQNLSNLYTPGREGERVRVWDNGEALKLEKQKEAYETFLYAVDSSSDESDGDDDDEELEEMEENGAEDGDDSDNDRPRQRRKLNTGKPSAKQRKEQRYIREKHREIIEKYYCSGTSHGPSVAGTVYVLASYLQLAVNETLWLAIVGLTYQYTSSRISRDDYDYWQVVYADEVARLNPRIDLSASTALHADDTSIRSCQELRFTLYRHWTLYDSMFHSPYVAGKMNIWKERGRRNLAAMFAKMGISLQEGQQDYSHMDRNFRKELPDLLETIGPEYGLVELQYPSFVRAYGFSAQPFAAADSVEAISALLDAGTGVRLEVEVDGGRGGGEWFGGARIWNASDGATKNKSTTGAGGGGKENLGIDGSSDGKNDEEDEKNKAWRKKFWLAYDALGSDSTKALQRAIPLAKSLHQIILSQGSELIERSGAIKTYRKFRMAILTQGAHLALFSQPGPLSRLALWLVDALREKVTAVKGPRGRETLPFVVACLDERAGSYLVVGVTGAVEFGDVRNNLFGLAFLKAKGESNARTRHGTFDTSVVEVNMDDLQLFTEALAMHAS